MLYYICNCRFRNANIRVRIQCIYASEPGNDTTLSQFAKLWRPVYRTRTAYLTGLRCSNHVIVSTITDHTHHCLFPWQYACISSLLTQSSYCSTVEPLCCSYIIICTFLPLSTVNMQSMHREDYRVPGQKDKGIHFADLPRSMQKPY